MQIEEMEGPEGTGPLEADVEVLKQVWRHVRCTCCRHAIITGTSAWQAALALHYLLFQQVAFQEHDVLQYQHKGGAITVGRACNAHVSFVIACRRSCHRQYVRALCTALGRSRSHAAGWRR